VQGGRVKGRCAPTLESDGRERLVAVKVPILAAGVISRQRGRVVGRSKCRGARVPVWSPLDSWRGVGLRSRSCVASMGVLLVSSVVTSGRPGRAARSFSQVSCGAGAHGRSHSERESKGHERAAVVVHPIICQPADPIPRRSEKAMAGVPNQYGARFVGRALCSPPQRDERRRRWR